MVAIIYVIALSSKGISSYDPEVIRQWMSSYSHSYSGFTPNKGQVATEEGKEAKEVIFYTRNGNLTAYITEKGISYVMYTKDNFSRIDYELIGSKMDRNKVEYYEELPGYENFYLGHCPDGILFVKSYRKVVIKEVYPNINWVFKYDEYGNLHHEFEVKKGGEIADIRIKVKYADLEIREKEIVMKTHIGMLIDGNLVAYEDGRKLGVNYRLEGDEIGFVVNGYSGNGNLVIDPQLVWSTYYGGEFWDLPSSIAMDNNSNIYIVGQTRSEIFPLYNPGGQTYFQPTSTYEEAFILKFNSNGVRLWATYYGGDGPDTAYLVKIDNNNNLYVAGYTFSYDFPTYNPGGGVYYQPNNGGNTMDVFILKFNSNGVRLWATYYGGYNTDRPYSMAMDNRNNLYIVGATNSNDFPTYDPGGGAYYDNHCLFNNGFIIKFDSIGRKLWATCYGDLLSAHTTPTLVLIGNNNDVYVVGYTVPDNFPTYDPGGGAYYQPNGNGYVDLFILRFDSIGVLKWATLYGGNKEEYAHFLFKDNNNNIYIVGRTWSTNFPTYNPGGQAYYQSSYGGGNDVEDAFILKFNSNGVRLWATYYGGNRDELIKSVFVDNNNLYMVGYTWSDDFPLYNPEGGAYFQGNSVHNKDAFILKFNSSGLRLWATRYGGFSFEEADIVFMDNDNNLYVIGNTYSDDFPLYNPGGVYFQNQNYGANDVFILKFTPNGVRQWATYFGGNDFDLPRFAMVDNQNSLYIVGTTHSLNFPIVNPGGGAYFQPNNAGNPDAFISKFGNFSQPIFTDENKLEIYDIVKIRNDRIILNIQEPVRLQFRIYSIDGMKKKDINLGKLNTGVYEISIKDLEKGIYLMEAIAEDKKEIIKFIKN